MAIALDYFRKLPEEDQVEKIFALVIIDEDGKYNTYQGKNLETCGDLLAMRARILTYGNTIRNLYPYLTPGFLEDWEVSKKVFDLFNYLKKETGHNIALGNLAKGTLGIDEKILRLPKNYDYDDDAEIVEKLEDRVKYIQQLWEYGLNHGKLYYYRNNILENVEVNLNDNFDAD